MEHDDVLRIVKVLEEPYRTIVAVMHSTGMEVSVVLSLLRRDVDFTPQQIQANDTKTTSRNRIVRVEPWAMPFLKRHARSLIANAPLFPDVSR